MPDRTATGKSPLFQLAEALIRIESRLALIEQRDLPVFHIKDDTGDPPSNFGNYHFVINTADSNIKVYADGDWRTLASW